MKTSKTCRCGLPALYRGAVYRAVLKADNSLSKRMKRETRWMCLQHYLENTCGLWAYSCVGVCEKKRAAASEADRHSAEAFVVWIDLRMMASTRDKRMHPRCPWCARKLRPWKPKPSQAQFEAD